MAPLDSAQRKHTRGPPAQISVDALGTRGQKMWKQAGRTLAPDCRHEVAGESGRYRLTSAERGYKAASLIGAVVRPSRSEEEIGG